MSQALLVENNPNLLELYSYALERAGCTVHKARNLKIALALLAHHKMDVIVTDYRYPGLYTEDKGGLELVKHAIDKGLLPLERILLMSTGSDLADLMRQEGISGIESMEKPSLLPLLANRVRKILAVPYRPDFPTNGAADNDNLNSLPKVG